MEITRQQSGAWVELHVKGRLDSYWATHFQDTVNDLIREGAHQIRLNLAGVSYLSSAGIGVLVAGHKQMQSLRGKLAIVNPSDAVKEVLDATRLTAFLAVEEAVPDRPRVRPVPTGLFLERDTVTFAIYDMAAGARLTCRPIGDPSLLRGCRFCATDCRKVRFPAPALAVGLGALGRDFEDCQGRFGEFLAACGVAAYLPTDGTNVPDYLVAAGDSIPDLMVCYALLCEGEFARHTRFEAKEETGRAALTELVRGCLDLAKADRIGLVVLGETAGLMGAALKRSPALGRSNGEPFAYPQVRDWLTFTPERAYPRSLVLVVGVAVRGEPGPLAPFVRPLGADPALTGHCHAAAFSYRPLPRGEIDLRTTVSSLFGEQTLQGILHLLADHRPAVGLGESEFVRGACWFGPIGDIAHDRS
jgi:anti-anti-sigma factor